MSSPGLARVLLDADELGAATDRLARSVSSAYCDGVLLVGVLPGSLPFVADLARRMTVVVEIDFVAVSAYERGAGRVRIVKDLDCDAGDRDVVLVVELVDTGLTCSFLREVLQARRPRSVEVCALLDRPVRRIVPVVPRFSGIEVPDEPLLGYGLTAGGRYGNLPFVAVGDSDARLEELYER